MDFPEIPAHEFRLILGRTRIEYDENKELSNRKKHGYSLESAVHYFERLCCKPDVGVSQIRTTTVLSSCFCVGQTVL